MDQQLRRPLIVWLTGIVLAISSAIIGTGLIGILFVYKETTPFQVRPILLLALSLAGLVGLARRKLWGREVALIFLASLWAFTLHGFWSIFGERPLIAFRTPMIFSVFIFLVTLLIVLPILFAKLRWAAASLEFFRV
jgi:hypothetical protein